MKKHTRSILEELNNLGLNRDNDRLIETTANNIINSSINLINTINQTYDAGTAGELERRFLNSIKSGDPRKFKRGIEKIIENKQRQDDDS
jgi:hypothetical protein